MYPCSEMFITAANTLHDIMPRITSGIMAAIINRLNINLTLMRGSINISRSTVLDFSSLFKFIFIFFKVKLIFQRYSNFGTIYTYPSVCVNSCHTRNSFESISISLVNNHSWLAISFALAAAAAAVLVVV